MCFWCGRFTAGAATLSWSAERALRKENGSGSKFAGALKEIELVVNLGIGTPGKSGSGGGGSESPVVSTPNSRLPSFQSGQLAKNEYRHSCWAAQWDLRVGVLSTEERKDKTRRSDLMFSPASTGGSE